MDDTARRAPWMVRALSNAVAALRDRVVMQEHGAVRVGDAVVCDGHPERTSWPCSQWRRAAARQAVRRSTASLEAKTAA